MGVCTRDTDGTAGSRVVYEITLTNTSRNTERSIERHSCGGKMNTVACVRLSKKVNGIVVTGIGSDIHIIDALRTDIIRHAPENSALPGAPVHGAADLQEHIASSVRKSGIVRMSIIPITKLFGLLICREHDRGRECVSSDGAEIIDAAVVTVVLGGNTNIAFRRRNGIVG